ncbi:MAG TPA: hypothetical protein VEB22_13695 [Phycisphaerales bacterium]|nr:hypothetical protein [Phycisphaerales bacterium]
MSYHESDRVWGYCIVLWPIPFLLCTSAAMLLRSGIRARRRALSGACGKCGYTLTGLGRDTPCPECGIDGGKTTA